jgi:hypothetical protein
LTFVAGASRDTCFSVAAQVRRERLMRGCLRCFPTCALPANG